MDRKPGIGSAPGYAPAWGSPIMPHFGRHSISGCLSIFAAMCRAWLRGLSHLYDWIDDGAFVLSEDLVLG